MDRVSASNGFELGLLARANWRFLERCHAERNRAMPPEPGGRCV